MSSITSVRDNAQKKSPGLAGAVIPFGEFDGTNEVTAFILPANVLVTRIVVWAGSATNTATVKAKIGSVTAVAAAPVSSVAIAAASHATTLTDSGTGVAVTLTPSAALTAGVVKVSVEFNEYGLGNGKLLDYS